MMISISYITPLTTLKPFFKSYFYTYLNVHHFVSFMMMIYQLESLFTIKTISDEITKCFTMNEDKKHKKQNQ